MTTKGLLSVLLGADVHWTACGDNLRVDAPRGVLASGIRQTIREHKSVLLDLACHRTPPGWTPEAWRNHLRDIADRFESRACERASELRAWIGPVRDIDPMSLPPDWRIEWEERAAIREYEGGQAREHAEAEALGEIIARMQAEEG